MGEVKHIFEICLALLKLKLKLRYIFHGLIYPIFSSVGFSLWGHTLSLGGNVCGHMFHVFIVEGVNLCPRNVDSFSDCSHVRLKNRAGTRCRLNWHLSGKMKHSCVQLFFTFLNLAFLFVCTASKINISQLYKKTSWFYFSTFPLWQMDRRFWDLGAQVFLLGFEWQLGSFVIFIEGELVALLNRYYQ